MPRNAQRRPGGGDATVDLRKRIAANRNGIVAETKPAFVSSGWAPVRVTATASPGFMVAPAVRCPCRAPATHLGCGLCAPSCAEHRVPCLFCWDWSWIEPRSLLPVREGVHRKPWQLQLPHDHPEAHGLTFLALCRGYRDDNAFPFITTDVPLWLAERLPWAG